MNILFAIGGLGGMEVVLILAVVLIMFGAKKIPELAKGLGQGIKEFKKATSDVQRDMHDALEAEPPRKLPPPSEPPAAAPKV